MTVAGVRERTSWPSLRAEGVSIEPFRDPEAEADLLDVLIATSEDYRCPCGLAHGPIRARLLGELSPADFAHPILRAAFVSVRDRIRDGDPAYWAVVARQLADRGVVADGPAALELLRWAADAGIHRYALNYLRRVKRARAFRAAWEATRSTAARLLEGDERALEEVSGAGAA